MTIREKLLIYIDFKRMNRKQFIEKSGLTNGFFGTNGSIESKKLESILKFNTDLSADWLLRDEGEMIRNLETNTNPSSQCDEKNALIDYLKEQLAKQTEMSQNLLKMFNEKN